MEKMASIEFAIDELAGMGYPVMNPETGKECHGIESRMIVRKPHRWI